MEVQRAAPSSADVATEANTVFVGLGILLLQFFPLALPGLLLFVIGPLALLALAGALLAVPLVLPVLLLRLLATRVGRMSIRPRAVRLAGEQDH